LYPRAIALSRRRRLTILRTIKRATIELIVLQNAASKMRDTTRRVMRMKRHRERKGPAAIAFMCLAIYERVARPLLKASP
jgi:hypothetical protein